MARGQSCGLGERQLRPYRAEDEPAVLALWARALPRWPVSAEAFRSKTTGAGQLVMVAGGALAGYISVARAETRARFRADRRDGRPDRPESTMASAGVH